MSDIVGYFGSDLNKYANSLPHVMTINNVDCVILKRSKKEILWVESKQSTEPLPWEKGSPAQHELLTRMAQNTVMENGWSFRIFVVRGSVPFDTVEVYEYKKSELKGVFDTRSYIPKKTTLTKSQLDKFLEVEQ